MPATLLCGNRGLWDLMPDTNPGHMTPDEFRRHGREVIDWIAEYMERVEDLPVLAQVEPGEVRSRLPIDPPEGREPFAEVLRDLDDILLPGITHWQSPNFFAYFPANRSGPSILGELLSAGLGVQGMLWATSPACTELESHVLDWVVRLLGLPEAFSFSGPGGGVIQDSASSAAVVAVLAARERATGYRSNEDGVEPGLAVYASAHAHSSIEKAVRIAGLGSAALRLIDVDDSYAMRADALERALEADVAAGRTPCMVAATIGTTSSTAIDPAREIGELCRRYGVWLHVDGAMAGSAAICPELRFVNDGIEFADSYCFNPHKWLLTNFDCTCFYVADRSALVRTLSVLPEYLRNAATESGAVVDYRDWQIPLGRRFRALKLWMVIRWYGAEGLRSLVRGHVELAQEFAHWVEVDDDFEVAAPSPLNLVCFRHLGGDAVNQELMDRLNASGDLYLTHTRLDGKLTLRISIGSAVTERRHVERAWRRIVDEAAALSQERSD
ncbi:MAG TPA: aminotransferase class V-fold PLP-dependent enzyme [Egibacteraceae bacterium]|nr:aminotransferase class V-fold PLP-dependent enzyme [Egibacteraceae bacterium]